MFSSSDTLLSPFGVAGNNNLLYAFESLGSDADGANAAIDLNSRSGVDELNYLASDQAKDSLGHSAQMMKVNQQLNLLINRTPSLLRSASTTAHNAANLLFSETNTPMFSSSDRCSCAFCGASPALLAVSGNKLRADRPSSESTDEVLRACTACAQRRNLSVLNLAVGSHALQSEATQSPSDSTGNHTLLNLNGLSLGNYHQEHTDLVSSGGLLERCIAALEEQRAVRHSSGAMSVDSGTGAEQPQSATTSSSGSALRNRLSCSLCSSCKKRPLDEGSSLPASPSNALVRCQICEEPLCAACAYQHRVTGCTATPGVDVAHDIFDVFDTVGCSTNKRSPGSRAQDVELDAELRALSVSSGALSGAASSGVNSNARNTPSASLSLSIGGVLPSGSGTGKPDSNSNSNSNSNGLHHVNRDREPSGGSAPQSPCVGDGSQLNLGYCQRHLGEPIRMYCRNCDQLVCQLCLFNDERLQGPAGDLRLPNADGQDHRQHDLQPLGTAIEFQAASVRMVNQEAKAKLNDLRQIIVGLQQSSTRLAMNFQQTQAQIDDTAAITTRLIADRRAELQRMLENAYQLRAADIGDIAQRAQEQLEKLQHQADFVDKLLAAAANPLNPNRGIELLLLHKLVVSNFGSLLYESVPETTRQFATLMSTCAPTNAAGHSGLCFPDLDYVVEEKLLQAGVTQLLGSLRGSSSSHQAQLGSIVNGHVRTATRTSSSDRDADLVDGSINGLFGGAKQERERTRHPTGSIGSNAAGNQFKAAATQQHAVAQGATGPRPASHMPQLPQSQNLGGSAKITNGNTQSARGLANEFSKLNMNAAMNSGPPVGALPSANGAPINATTGQLHALAALQAAGSGAGVDLAALSAAEQREIVTHLQLQQAELSAKLAIPLPQLVLNSMMNASGNGHLANGAAPMLRSTIKRTKMIYNVKFGEFGVLNGQFTEPSGVAVSLNNEIIVADTNNHRIQVFDADGHFKFQFGECGKRDSQLLYPNRVAVNPMNGDIVVTERSPTHQIQIYNKSGQFLRKFGANILQHPRGVTVDNKGRILVVECKVMRILIFDQHGNLLSKFGCSKYLEFPNAIAVNHKEEIFISDNRAHCVKVFDYFGRFLRQVGGEGVTNYPIGVAVSPSGEVLVADNHNNFNLTVFGADGELIAALESKVKHAQCFDIALLRDASDSIVLASKDYRLYVYRYKNPLPVGD